MKIQWIALLLGFGCVLAACIPTAGITEPEREIEAELRTAGQDLTGSRPPDYQQLLPFDGILPIYDPEFVPAGDAPYHPDELIIGIAIDGQAKAYPITVLRFREMVNDELAGIPILVTW